jgi:hypothetical protein
VRQSYAMSIYITAPTAAKKKISCTTCLFTIYDKLLVVHMKENQTISITFLLINNLSFKKALKQSVFTVIAKESLYLFFALNFEVL